MVPHGDSGCAALASTSAVRILERDEHSQRAFFTLFVPTGLI